MKEKLKSIYNKYNNIILTFLAALIVIVVIFYIKNISPFGEKSLLAVDFFHQYAPMLGELYNRVMNGNNLIYSFTMGLGLPFFRNFFNYLSSPFNIILFLFKHKDLVISYSYIIGLKSIFSSVLMNYYLSKKFNQKNLYFIGLSLFYGFSAYFVAYYWNIMWLDGMVFLPLIIYGIEKLVDEDKPVIYIISLSIMLFSNYFIGYMLCIFSVIYFIVYLIIYLNKKDLKVITRKVLYFTISSLIVGGLCSWFLIPLYNTLNTISATGDPFPSSQFYSFPLINLFLKHISGINTTVFKSDLFIGPNISTGILTFVLFILFLINPKINKKIKVVYSSILIFIVFSFFNGPLDYIWHAFHVPNDLPFRYSFIYSFIFVLIGTYSLINIKYIKPKIVSVVYITMMILITILYFLYYTIIDKNVILFNLVLLTVYFTLYYFSLYKNKFKKYIPLLFIAFATIECIVVINFGWNISQNTKNFYYKYSDIQKALNYIKENGKEMSRIEKTEILTYNDSSWYDYFGYTAFSSMEYEDLVYLQYVLGNASNEINSFIYKQNTPVYDLMYNIKYIIDTNNTFNNLYYTKEYKNLYRNNYTLGLMFGVTEDIRNWNIYLGNPFEIQNEFVRKSTNMDIDVFKSIEIYSREKFGEESSLIIKYTIKPPKNNTYLYFNDSNIEYVIINDNLYYFEDKYKNVNVSDIDILKRINYREKYIINTNAHGEEYTFYVKYKEMKDENFYVYFIDNEAFLKFYSHLKNNKINITNFKENYIEANSNFYENKTVYTSIPYDKGWKVFVDNLEVETFKVGESLLSFDVSGGDHKIVLKYQVPYLTIGTTISVITMLYVTGYLICKKNKNYV